MQVKFEDIFPTRLWSFDIPELQSNHAAWEAHIHAWREAAPTGGRSNRMGWNSDKTVFAQDLFAPLRDAAKAAFQHAFREMQPAAELRFLLEGWVNLHEPGGFNMLHTHPHVQLCGCYYLRVPAGAGPIKFRDPRPGVNLTPFNGRGLHSGGAVSVQPAEGQLIVFPHWLEHCVEPNDGNTPRIAIAMNALHA